MESYIFMPKGSSESDKICEYFAHDGARMTSLKLVWQLLLFRTRQIFCHIYGGIFLHTFLLLAKCLHNKILPHADYRDYCEEKGDFVLFIYYIALEDNFLVPRHDTIYIVIALKMISVVILEYISLSHHKSE